MEVVVLAGGAGRRFGGEKQFTPVGPDGATLLEITLRDARRVGCDRAVIVTAPGREDAVGRLFEERPAKGLEISVVLQRPEDLPDFARVDRSATAPDEAHGAPLPSRPKPWGTAHALWAARHQIEGPFLLFNADDHYGPGAPGALAAALARGPDRASFALLGYPLGTTLSNEGTVSRAVCEIDPEGRLLALHEHHDIDGQGRVTSGIDTGQELPLESLVSMNAWAFTPDVVPLLEAHLRQFLATADLATEECLLPEVMGAAIEAGEIEVKVVESRDLWCGMTWPGDRARVASWLDELESPRLAAEGFGLEVTSEAPRRFGDGLIHATWLVDSAQGPHLVQRLDDGVFPDSSAMAENAAAAALRVSEALRSRGDDDPRHRLEFRAGSAGRPWMRDGTGAVWRAAVLIPGARPADASRPRELRAAARALGRFPGLLAEGSGPAPREILPGFHDPIARLDALRRALDADLHGRLAGCRDEVRRVLEHSSLASRLSPDAMPTRWVHNDAKLDNVLVDSRTGELLCVVDLDTVMPGLAVHDFGDLVRSAVTGRPEDEPDLDAIEVREEVFGDLVDGYLEGANVWITPAERSRLVDGAIVITLEQAARFLTDHLEGDSYYRVDGPGHNLRRAGAQLRLLDELLDSESFLRSCIDGA